MAIMQLTIYTAKLLFYQSPTQPARPRVDSEVTVVKGILTDVKLRALSKLSNFEFFAYFRSAPLRTLPQRNEAFSRK